MAIGVGGEFLPAVSPRIVLQIEALEGCRRVWVASVASKGNRYQIVEAPTQGLPQFRGLRVSGLTCAETPAGRDRILVALGPDEPVCWRDVSIDGARTIARQLAARTGGVVHLALFDEPNRIVWEPVAVTC